jgi:hypothetical protein
MVVSQVRRYFTSCLRGCCLCLIDSHSSMISNGCVRTCVPFHQRVRIRRVYEWHSAESLRQAHERLSANQQQPSTHRLKSGEGITTSSSWSFGSFIDSVCSLAWHYIQDTVDKVIESVKVITALAELGLTGDLSVSPTDQQIVGFGVNYNIDKKLANGNLPMDSGIDGVTGSCSNCYAYAGLTLHFEITISNYSLVSAQLYVLGSLELNVEGSFDFQQQYVATFKGQPQTPYVSPSMSLSLAGLSFTVQVTVPYSYGATAHFDTKANIQFFAKASGSFKRGIQVLASDADKTPKPLSEDKPLTYASDIKFVQATANVTANVWFLATIIPQISGFGGPTVGLRFFADGMIAMGVVPDDVAGLCSQGLTGCGSSATMAKVQVNAGTFQEGSFIVLCCRSLRPTLS